MSLVRMPPILGPEVLESIAEEETFETLSNPGVLHHPEQVVPELGSSRKRCVEAHPPDQKGVRFGKNVGADGHAEHDRDSQVHHPWFSAPELAADNHQRSADNE